jgi:glycosyltransferase involved in cell wall biosynthesis
MNATDTPRVSLVTPVYNGAEYLDECITSVLEQTYPNWDYTILDNCSKDDTFAIAQRYAARDPRIRVIRADEFVGQVANINRTMRLISDESVYCKPLLADDWLFPRCLEEMVQVAQLSDRIGLVGSYSMYRDRVHHHGLPFSRRPVYPGREAARRYLLSDSTKSGFIGSPTCVMFRSELVRTRDPFFVENLNCEDVEACLEVLEHWDFGFVFQVLTYNRRDNESVMTRMQRFSPDLLNDLLLAYRIGGRFLAPEEHAARTRSLEKDYYAMLGDRAMTHAAPGFWEFHERALAGAGRKIDRSRVWRAAARHVLGTVLTPKNALKRLFGGRSS